MKFEKRRSKKELTSSFRSFDREFSNRTKKTIIARPTTSPITSPKPKAIFKRERERVTSRLEFEKENILFLIFFFFSFESATMVKVLKKVKKNVFKDLAGVKWQNCEIIKTLLRF